MESAYPNFLKKMLRAGGQFRQLRVSAGRGNPHLELKGGMRNWGKRTQEEQYVKPGKKVTRCRDDRVGGVAKKSIMSKGLWKKTSTLTSLGIKGSGKVLDKRAGEGKRGNNVRNSRKEKKDRNRRKKGDRQRKQTCAMGARNFIGQRTR